jgi:hypothetical protein
MKGLQQGLSISPSQFAQKQGSIIQVRPYIDDLIVTNMFTAQERRDIVAQLIRACTALLIVEMNEDDRQVIFEHIRVVVNRITIFLLNSQ